MAPRPFRHEDHAALVLLSGVASMLTAVLLARLPVIVTVTGSSWLMPNLRCSDAGSVVYGDALGPRTSLSMPKQPAALLKRYEVGVRYSNGDEIRGQFKDKVTAVAFLRGMR